MAHQIMVTLPNRIYEELCRWAKVQKKSVRKVAEETLSKATLKEEALSLSLEAELRALAEKSDDDLWQIAKSQLPNAKMRRWRRLINKHETGHALMPDEKRELEILIEEGERLTAIKSEAYMLLKRRGHHVPTLEELREHQQGR